MPDIKILRDLRNEFGPARDQGSRPTCLVFATSDAHAAVRGGWTALSCEYLFFHAQRRAGKTQHQGASLMATLAAVRQDGQPAETTWPYMSRVEVPWMPPTHADPIFARNGERGAIEIPSVVARLEQGKPVVLLTTLSRSFFCPDPHGVVDPANDENPVQAQKHAVIAVGHGTVDGTQAILVRNSWGTAWGQAGHAWLTERFLKPRLFATAHLLENIDVSSGSFAA